MLYIITKITTEIKEETSHLLSRSRQPEVDLFMPIDSQTILLLAFSLKHFNHTSC